jgi:hypothetical protein
MFDRTILSVAIALSLACLLGSGTALASVKCQCNNGATSHAMDADYDDDDAEDACNDACSTMGGGRVWNVDRDRSDGDTTVIREDRVDPRPAAPRR